MLFSYSHDKEHDTLSIKLDLNCIELTESEYESIFEFEGEFDEFLISGESINNRCCEYKYSVAYDVDNTEDADKIANTFARDILDRLSSVFDFRANYIND
jgi:hypothetical protein